MNEITASLSEKLSDCTETDHRWNMDKALILFRANDADEQQYCAIVKQLVHTQRCLLSEVTDRFICTTSTFISMYLLLT